MQILFPIFTIANKKPLRLNSGSVSACVTNSPVAEGFDGDGLGSLKCLLLLLLALDQVQDVHGFVATATK